MAQLECIDISSSDDDLDLEEIENPNNGNRSGWPSRDNNAGGWKYNESFSCFLEKFGNEDLLIASLQGNCSMNH